MRCKVGDVVMVVNSFSHQNIGKIGTIIGPHDSGNPRNHWLCEFPSKVRGFDSKSGAPRESERCNFPDPCLQPIRDNDGEDEMLRLVGKPNEERASKEKAHERAWLEQFN